MRFVNLNPIMYKKNDTDIITKFIMIYNKKNPSNDYHINYPDEYRIFDIYSKMINNKLYIKILTNRPGIFIGRRGENIDFFKKEFSEIYGLKKIIIELYEYDPFDCNNKYNTVVGEIKLRFKGVKK